MLVSIGPILDSRATQAAPQASNPIKHIVIIVKENRTFDDYFGTFPGADGATTYKDKNGQVHPLNHQPDRLFFDIGHTHNDFELGYDNGKMDGFSKIPGAMQFVNGKKVDYQEYPRKQPMAAAYVRLHPICYRCGQGQSSHRQLVGATTQVQRS